MEKVAYLLNRPAELPPHTFRDRLRQDFIPSLLEQGAHRVMLDIEDERVAGAARIRVQHCDPVIHGVLFAWVDSANSRHNFELELSRFAGIIAAYLLAESEPRSVNLTGRSGERSPGMMQLAFLKVPSRISVDEWFDVWRGEHTSVALDLQSTFLYRQNLVVRCLTPHDPGFSAIVEEGFPEAAMSSREAYFAAKNATELAAREAAMWESSKRFIDFADLDVLPTSEYVWSA
jgi:hypothetical protein